jgi:putative SOS response-associated peptidase YedK
MCGRFTQHMSWQKIVETYNLTANLIADIPALNLRPDDNVAPTHDALMLRLAAGVVTPGRMRGRLVPFWAKGLKIGYKLINARSETAAYMLAGQSGPWTRIGGGKLR